MLDSSDRSELIRIARNSIASGFSRVSPSPPPEREWAPELLEPRATFTTLKLAGELRGCCGTVEPQRPLAHDVWHNAWVSANADPRFWPVSPMEVDALEICISVLTPLEPIPVSCESELVEALEPGVDGLLLRCGSARAVFLPAVWESLPDAGEFITHLKEKAGWSPAFWSPDMVASRFRTETFTSGSGVVPH
jgi:uncharacterized protein